jgi:hypothetical protein
LTVTRACVHPVGPTRLTQVPKRALTELGPLSYSVLRTLSRQAAFPSPQHRFAGMLWCAAVVIARNAVRGRSRPPILPIPLSDPRAKALGWRAAEGLVLPPSRPSLDFYSPTYGALMLLLFFRTVGNARPQTRTCDRVVRKHPAQSRTGRRRLFRADSKVFSGRDDRCLDCFRRSCQRIRRCEHCALVDPIRDLRDGVTIARADWPRTLAKAAPWEAATTHGKRPASVVLIGAGFLWHDAPDQLPTEHRHAAERGKTSLCRRRGSVAFDVGRRA